MKNLSLIISLLALAGVLALGGMYMNEAKKREAAEAAAATAKTGTNVAYVNIDSLEAKYELLKTKREDFRNRQAQMEAELQRSYGQMQSKADEIQKKAQANTLTQAEYEAAQKQMMQMQQSLESRKESLTEELMKEQEAFNTDLKTRLDAFLKGYSKTHQYDFILSYSGAGSAVIYASGANNITQDVIDGMNASAKSEANKK